MKHSPVSRPDRPDGKGYVMRKSSKTKAAIPVVWPDQRFKGEAPAGEIFTAYAERPFDPTWGLPQWGHEIRGQRGPQPFHVPVLDENGNPVLGQDKKPLFMPDELHDVVVLTGTGPGRGTRHIEANSPDWRLPVGLTLRRPFSGAGEALLREMGLAKRHSDAFELEPKLLRTALLTTCNVAPEILPTRTGAQIEAILRQHAAALGVASETPAGGANANRVEWNDADPDYIAKREAVELAVRAGRDHDVEELRTMDYGRMRNLLRGRKCEIRYMVTQSKPARGKVHRADWESYIRGVVREHEQMEGAVEKRIRSLA